MNEITVDVKPSLDPRQPGVMVATAIGTCPSCEVTATRVVHTRDDRPARAAMAASIQARRSIEDMLMAGCPRCQLAAAGWTFGELAPRLSVVS